MKKIFSVMIICFFVLSGCDAASINKEIESNSINPYSKYSRLKVVKIDYEWEGNHIIKTIPLTEYGAYNEDGIDLNDLEMIIDGGCGGYYKDDNNIYFYNIKLDIVDRDSFYLVRARSAQEHQPGNKFARDKNHIYRYLVGGKGCMNTIGLLEGVDPQKFTYLGGSYFKYDGRIYFTKYHQNKENHSVDSADVNSFHVMSYNYAKDNNYVYYYGQILQEADASSFVAINREYGKDKDTCFYRNEILLDCDIETFISYGEHNNDAKDKYRIY